MNLEFESDRLYFRPICDDDLDIATDIWTSEEVTKFLGGTISEAEVKKDFQTTLRRCGDGCIGIWILTTKHDGQKIGSTVLLPLPVEKDDTDWDLVVGDGIPDAEIEVGYILMQSAWGMGYATEACKRMIQFAFEETPLTEIVACTDHENLNSQHVLTKCGLRKIGLIKAYAGEYPGFHITVSEWLDKNGSPKSKNQ